MHGELEVAWREFSRESTEFAVLLPKQLLGACTLPPTTSHSSFDQLQQPALSLLGFLWSGLRATLLPTHTAESLMFFDVLLRIGLRIGRF